jgi:hypothetical protein
MKLGFTDWRKCSQDVIPLTVSKDRLFYIQAQAWHLKGYTGGTHSWLTFWSTQHNDWLVVELTDQETLWYQNGDTVYHGSTTDVATVHAPYITTRPYNSQWFGHDPYIVDSCFLDVDYSDILLAAKNYPIKDFKLLYQNCNTFTSYMIWKLNLKLKRPFRSIGFRNKNWWQENYGT